jgi:hypothetical protein
VTADDDEARWLLEEEPTAAVTQLRPVAAAAADDAAPTAPVEDAPAAEPELPSGTQEAIETLLRGRETVPDTPPTKRKKKASVPSWDEILFGSRKPE